MAELGDFLRDNDDVVDVDVTVDMLDYEFVKSCNDTKKLRSILKVLESGKEGHYPHLVKTVEDKLLGILPERERQRVLRLRKDISPIDIQKAEDELRDWQNTITERDSELKCNNHVEDMKSGIFEKGSGTNRPLPLPRGSKNLSKAIDIKSKPIAKASNLRAEDKSSEQQPKPTRISGYNFRAWEKFDVDKALEDMDEAENTNTKSNAEFVRNSEAEQEERKQKRFERFQAELLNLREVLKTRNLSRAEREFKADRERIKGNEAYRVGDNEEAYACYSRSLAYNDSSAIVYANRAMVSLRLEKYESASDDCSRAIAIDPAYSKAWSRRATCEMKMGRYAAAIEDFQKAFELGPEKGRPELESLMRKAREMYRDVEGRDYDEVQRRLKAPKYREVAVIEMAEAEKLKYLPGRDSVLIRRGHCEIQSVEPSVQGRTFPAPSVGVDQSDSSPAASGFRRIVISEDSDEEEESEGEGETADSQGGGGLNGQAADIPSITGSSGGGSGFVRVQIVDEDSEDEAVLVNDPEDKGSTVSTETPKPRIAGSASESTGFHRVVIEDDSGDEKGETGQFGGITLPTTTSPLTGASPIEPEGFTRVVIEDDSESDEEGGQPPPTAASVTNSSDAVSAELKAEAVKLKEEGNRLVQTGDYAAAIMSYNKCLALDPLHWPALSNRALAFLKNNEFEAAVSDCSALISSSGMGLGIDDTLVTKAFFRRAQALLRSEGSGGLSLALQDVETVLLKDKDNAQASELQAMILERLSKLQLREGTEPAAVSNSSNAQPTAAGAVSDRDPSSVDGRNDCDISTLDIHHMKKKALASLENGKPEDAVLILNEALDIIFAWERGDGPGSAPASVSECQDLRIQLYTILASADAVLGHHDAVVETCSAVLSFDPRNVKALIRRSYAAMSMNDVEKAKQDAFEALRINPSSAEAMTILDQLSVHAADPIAGTSQARQQPESKSSEAPEENQKLSVQLKDRGNTELKNQNYNVAIELYTQALTKDDKNIAAVCNRSLAYLKISSFAEAERDATQVLEAFDIEEAAVDPNLRLKALYRRALALKGRGGAAQYQAALADLDLLLALEPSNKEAQAESSKIEMLLKTGSKKTTPPSSIRPPPPPASKQVTASMNPSSSSFAAPSESQKLDIGLSERATTRRKLHQPIVVETSSNDATVGNIEKKATTKAAEELPSKDVKSSPQGDKKIAALGKGAVTMASTATAALLSSTAVPTVPPKTAYELERVWRGLRGRPDLISQYTKTFKKATFKKVFTETLSPDLVSSLFQTMQDFTVKEDSAAALAFLEGFTNVPKFDMTVTLLPERDVECIRRIFAQLKSCEDEEAVTSLRLKYPM